MLVPCGPAMNPLVEDIPAHDSTGELWGIDANQKDLVSLSPGDELIGKEGGMSELDREFLGANVLDELL